MIKISSFYKNRGPVATILSVVFSVLFVVAVVQAATTIGTNIKTDGTVSVTGLSTFGNASSTQLSVFNNAYFGGTATTTISSTGAVAAQSITIGAGGTSIEKHLSATASLLDFPVIGANSCESQTITVTGAADGDTVSLGVPTALANASTTFAVTGFVSETNIVTVRICQVATSASSDPAAATVRADVWQH